MPLFEYQATDSHGLSITAEITAKDALSAAEQLRDQGLSVTRITQKTQSFQDRSKSLLHELVDRQIELSGAQQIERPPDRPVTCGWCETQVPPPVTVTNCPNCGGNLPLPPGPDRGPPPPALPRHIPRQFEYKLKFGSLFWFGLLFFVIGVVLALPTIGFTLIFAAVGGFLLRSSWRTANNRIAALRNGQVAEGEVTFVGYDETLTVNGKHPYLVRYRWQVGSGYREGQKTTWNDAAMDHFRGEPLWVVYMPDDTTKSAIWPPLA